MARKRPLPPSELDPVPLSPYERTDVDAVHALAQEWVWKGRGGDPKVQAAARVLEALSWALRDHDGDALEELAAVAGRYFALTLERYGLSLDPFVPIASTAYERIMGSVERQLTGENNAASRENAAQWFVIVARRDGFLLPALPSVDKRAIPILVAALGKWRRKVFDDARDQAESWTRCMAEAAGRKDAANAAKARMKKPSK